MFRAQTFNSLSLFFALFYIYQSHRIRTKVTVHYRNIVSGLRRTWFSAARFWIRFVLEDISHRWFSKSMRYRHGRLITVEKRIVSAENPGGIAPVVVAAAVVRAFNFRKKQTELPERCKHRSQLDGSHIARHSPLVLSSLSSPLLTWPH